MKRMRLYATILGLLTCAAAANAQQLRLVDANGNPVTDAQFIAITDGNKIVQLPPAAGNGTVDLSSLAGLENITNKTIEVVVDRCDQDPRTRVYYLLPGQTAPENKEHCKRYRAGAIFWDGSRWVIRTGAESGSPFHFEGPWEKPVSTGPVGGGPSFFNVKGQFSVGFWDALDLPHECAGVPGCSTSNKAFALEGGFGVGFGPVDLLLGGFKTTDVKTTATFTGEGTFTSTEKWHVNAFEYGARPNLLGFKLAGHSLTVGPQGGGLVWTIKGTSSFSDSTTSGSEGFSYGGHAGWWGGHAEWSLCDHLAATFDYKHSDLHSRSLTENLNYFGFGVSVSAEKPKSFFKLGG